jgi:SAM-dependent methyltransferase
MKTVEPQYNKSIELASSKGIERLGIGINYAWHDDPKRFAFTFSRYKFVSKMLEGLQNVLEIGCGDGFASRIVKQSVGALIATDIDPVFINDALARSHADWPIDFRVHDMLKGPVEHGSFTGAYSLDVLEHISEENEDLFISNIVASLTTQGVFIVGTPSLESQPFASIGSKLGHVNCKTNESMRRTLLRHFTNVFIFSMNDEVVHTGYARMAQYVIGLATGPKQFNA